jgi:hypothetical protein
VKYFEIFRVVLEDFVGRDLVKIREKKSSTDKIKHLFGPSLNSGEKFLPFFLNLANKLALPDNFAFICKIRDRSIHPDIFPDKRQVRGSIVCGCY